MIKKIMAFHKSTIIVILVLFIAITALWLHYYYKIPLVTRRDATDSIVISKHALKNDSFKKNNNESYSEQFIATTFEKDKTNAIMNSEHAESKENIDISDRKNNVLPDKSRCLFEGFDLSQKEMMEVDRKIERLFKQCEEGEDVALEELIGMLHNTSWYIRYSVVKKISQLDKQTVIPYLLNALYDKNIHVRRKAAYGLRNFINDNMIPELIEVLKQDDDEAVHCYVIYALSKSGNAIIIPDILAELKNESEEVRCAAIQSLRLMHYSDAMPELLNMLNDDSAAVRVETIKALGSFGDKRIIPELLSVLEAEEIDVDVEAYAASELIRLGDEHGFTILDEFLENKNEIVQLAAAKGYININNNKGVIALIKVARSSNITPEWQLIKYKGAIPVLINNLQGDDIDTEIMEVLKELTEQDFGSDAAKWRGWWEENKARILQEEAEKEKAEK